jgi:hypothetical protein
MFALAVFLFVLTVASRLARLGVQRRLVALDRFGVGVPWWRSVIHPPVVLAMPGPWVLCRCRPLAWRTLARLARCRCWSGWDRAAVAVLPALSLVAGRFLLTSDELFYQSVPQRVFLSVGLIVVYRRTVDRDRSAG